GILVLSFLHTESINNLFNDVPVVHFDENLSIRVNFAHFFMCKISIENQIFSFRNSSRYNFLSKITLTDNNSNKLIKMHNGFNDVFFPVVILRTTVVW